MKTQDNVLMPLTCFVLMSHTRHKMNPTVGNTKVYSKEKISPHSKGLFPVSVSHKEMLNVHFNNTTQ